MISQINSNGDVEWSKAFGLDDTDYGKSIIKTSSDNYLIVGRTGDEGANEANGVVLEINQNGAQVWHKEYIGTDNDGIDAFEFGDGARRNHGESHADHRTAALHHTGNQRRRHGARNQAGGGFSIDVSQPRFKQLPVGPDGITHDDHAEKEETESQHGFPAILQLPIFGRQRLSARVNV